ncbi:MAG: ABC transporter substrate-binding protein [bacterium]
MINIKSLNVLAVGDPAVSVYVDPEYNFLDEFKRANNIEVNFDIVSFNNYFNVLMDSFKEYKYDIVMVAGHLWLKEFVEKGYISELKSKPETEYNYSDILESIRSELELDGKKYLLPSFCDGHILVYRKSEKTRGIMEKIEIDELINYVEKFDKNNRPFVLKADQSEIFLDILPYLRGKGLEPFSDTGEFQLNNEKGIKALKNYFKMRDYSRKEVKNYGNQEVREAIQKNNCELAVTWSGQLGEVMDQNCINQESLVFAYLEKPWKTTWSFALNSLSQKKEIAEMFMQYITSKNVDRIVGTNCGNPTRLSSFKADQEKYRWYKIVLKMIRDSEELPKLANLSELINICSKEFYAAFIGEISIKESLDNIEKLIN